MKRQWIAMLLLALCMTADYSQAQSNYRAVLRVGVVDTAYNQNEWAVYVYVDIFDAGNTNMKPG